MRPPTRAPALTVTAYVALLLLCAVALHQGRPTAQSAPFVLFAVPTAPAAGEAATAPHSRSSGYPADRRPPRGRWPAPTGPAAPGPGTTLSHPPTALVSAVSVPPALSNLTIDVLALGLGLGLGLGLVLRLARASRARQAPLTLLDLQSTCTHTPIAAMALTSEVPGVVG